jgi:D-alanine-D-alanine ligase
LQAQGHSTERVGNIQQLVPALAKGQRWDLVFNIAEGWHGLAREAQIPALLDAYRIPYTFSDPLTMALTLDKAMAKCVVRDHGIKTAPFAVVTTDADLAEIEHAISWPVFAKPLAEGTSKGINSASYVDSLPALHTVCQPLWQQFRQPVLVENYLSGREFTVGILGTGANAQVIGIMEIHFKQAAEAGGYSFSNKAFYKDRIEYQLVQDAEAQRAAATALQAWRVLRCRDGGRVDLRSDHQGEPHFLEVNPIAGLHPEHSDLVILARLQGIAYTDLLAHIITTCRQRLAL